MGKSAGGNRRGGKGGGRIGLRDLCEGGGGFDKVCAWVAVGFGVGLVRWAPGTAGSALGLGVYAGLAGLAAWQYLVVLIGAFAVGVVVCGRAGRRFAAEDDPRIVWDEMVGMWVTLFLVPISLEAVVVGFLLFRALDIWKPWPIGMVERRAWGGWGVMADDVVAGVLANVALRVLLPFLPG